MATVIFLHHAFGHFSICFICYIKRVVLYNYYFKWHKKHYFRGIGKIIPVHKRTLEFSESRIKTHSCRTLERNRPNQSKSTTN